MQLAPAGPEIRSCLDGKHLSPQELRRRLMRSRCSRAGISSAECGRPAQRQGHVLTCLLSLEVQSTGFLSESLALQSPRETPGPCELTGKVGVFVLASPGTC